MRSAEVTGEERISECIHFNERADLLVQSLRLNGTDTEPPLAIERLIREERSNKPPIVLVHGLAQNRYSWRSSTRSLAGKLAAEGHEVLNLELRGHGNSRAYGAGNATDFDQYVSDLVRVVADCEQPPFVIGHSLGGAVGVGAATRIKLSGLVHLAGVYTFATDNIAIRAVCRLSLRAEALLMLSPARMNTGWAGKIIGRLYRISDIAGYGFPIAGWAPNSIERELLEERLRLGFDWESVEVWLQMCRWAAGEQLAYAKDFEQLDIPLLVIAGDHDALARPRDAWACFDASGSSDREIVVFDNYNHQVHWGHLDLILGRKAPEETWPVLLKWLDDRS